MTLSLTDKSASEVVKQLVLANEDQEIKSIAAITTNPDGEIELYMGLNSGDAYRLISGLEILKLQIIKKLMDDGAKPLKDRE